ncbi:MAG: 50S rRNA methyltransferase [Gammaproteobacteria bacterium HGW-Gammaproteobacteria-11]|nr:MAG: 50S rRNA methyltransferase [Gammaproteobacteria bacterium HGW-Gammaproteobacteria-11]
MQACNTPFGALQLDRYPETRNPTLQPFDTADLYLLQQLADASAPAGPILVINDQFGTLACALALAGLQVHSWTDSFLAQQALINNLQSNGLKPDAVRSYSSQETPEGPYARVLVKVPKSLSLLEDQLSRLRERLTDDAEVNAGAMVKHLPHSAGDLLARYIGPYQASLAWKKARLLNAKMDPSLTPAKPELITRYALEGSPFSLQNQPGVFSREHLDIGTRALLACLPSGQGSARIVDLGCGNGALGIRAAELNPEAQLLFIDESYAAVSSAKANFTLAFPERQADFVVADGLLNLAPGSADLILCNPPFHQQQVIGDELAMRLFEQSKAVLTTQGRLIIVGNRHMGYHVKLRTFFNKIEQLSAHPKFNVLAAWE